jgi:hypothetical protein
MKTASHVQSSQPGTLVAGIWRATYHQPSRAAIAASGSVTMSIVELLAFITEAAATAIGDGATRELTASKVRARPSARRGASWLAGCSKARPPVAEAPSPASAPTRADVPVPSGWRSTSASTSAPATTSRPACSSAAVKPNPNALPTDWKVMSAAMP